MKKAIIFIIIMAILPIVTLQAEVILKVKIEKETKLIELNSLDVKYVELLGYSKLFSRKISVSVDYGPYEGFIMDPEEKSKKGKAKAMNFYGMVDALNFMDKNGWEYVNSYVITSGSQNVYHYLLKRKEINK